MSGILQEFITGGVQTGKCVDVVINPDGGTPPLTVSISTTTPGAHIFYTVAGNVGIDPTHTGDSATGSTVRLGSNSGSVNITSGGPHTITVVLRALAYEPSHLDSDITEGDYDTGL